MKAGSVIMFWMVLLGADGAAIEVDPLLAEQLKDHPSVRDLTIRFDGKEGYFSSQSLNGEVSAIMCMRKEEEKWSKPELAVFSGENMDLEPFLAADGLRLYFVSNRRHGQDSGEPNYDIWFVERIGLDAPWSDAVNLGGPVNTPGNEFYPSLTSSGDLYFTSDGAGSKGQDDIFVSRLVEGKYASPVSLGEAINSGGYEFNAFVAPDESYLLFTAYNREGGYGSGDLYISYRDKAGEWSPAENLGADINSSRMDYCPFVDTAGNLYFTSKRAEFPEPPYGIRSASEWVELLSMPENGQSRLYKTKVAYPFSRQSGGLKN